MVRSRPFLRAPRSHKPPCSPLVSPASSALKCPGACYRSVKMRYVEQSASAGAPGE